LTQKKSIDSKAQTLPFELLEFQKVIDLSQNFLIIYKRKSISQKSNRQSK